MIFVYFIGILLLALFAYKKESLTLGGTITAIIVASFILLGFSLQGLILLAVFFFSSSIIGKIQPKHSFQDDSSMVQKGHRRDASQVLANGAWPALMAYLFYMTSHLVWYYSFITVIAAVTSDTWASELGRHSRKRPLHFFTLKPLPTGQSGGVSILGTVAAIFGSFFIVALAYISQFFQDMPRISLSIAFALGLIGFLGQIADTVVGGTLQRLNRCTICEKETEQFLHCGKRTRKVKGLSFMTNDMVNHACSLAAIGLTLAYVTLII